MQDLHRDVAEDGGVHHGGYHQHAANEKSLHVVVRNKVTVPAGGVVSNTSAITPTTPDTTTATSGNAMRCGYGMDTKVQKGWEGACWACTHPTVKMVKLMKYEARVYFRRALTGEALRM